MKFKVLWLWNIVLVGLLCSTLVHSELDEDAEIEDEGDTVESQEPAVQIEKPVYRKPELKGSAFLAEPFHSETDFKKKWVKSDAKKDDTDEVIAKYDGKWAIEEPNNNPLEGDLALVLKSRAKHHAISAKLDKPYEFNGKPFIAQYEVKFQNGQECGGAYVKLLSNDDQFNLKNFYDKTGYTIMFGPDKCGNDNKLHFIFRHRNPVSGKFEEKHAKKPTAALDGYFTDKRVHLFTLVIKPDNTFEVFVDQDLINSGSLLEDMSPPVNPPAEIIDPEDKKPEDWDEREKIPDPEAVKPEDWDESQPEMIEDADATMPEGWLEDEPELKPDPESEMPEDWDEDMDGEWEPPMIQNPICEEAPGCGEWKAPEIKNPLYKGKWRAPMIDNPNYKGKWKPMKIANPDFFEDKEPYKMTAIGAIGLELWSMSDDIAFDNFIITDDKSVADSWAADTWALKRKQELFKDHSASRSVVDAVLDATNERPWLWAVFIVVIILPIVLVIAYCCMPGSSKPQETSAHAKKTDEVTPDDKEKKEEDDEEEEEEEEEVETEKKEEKDQQGAGDAASEKNAKAKKSDLEADEESNEADNEEENGSKQSTRSSPRKRKSKPRKD